MDDDLPKSPSRDEILTILTIHQNQEELHELNAAIAFTAFTNLTIEPCEYVFPVQNFNEAIALAGKFVSDLQTYTVANMGRRLTPFIDRCGNGYSP